MSNPLHWPNKVAVSVADRNAGRSAIFAGIERFEGEAMPFLQFYGVLHVGGAKPEHLAFRIFRVQPEEWGLWIGGFQCAAATADLA